MLGFESLSISQKKESSDYLVELNLRRERDIFEPLIPYL